MVKFGEDGKSTITKDIWAKFQTRFNTAVLEQRDNLSEAPCLIQDAWFNNNRIIIEPANEYSQTKAKELLATVTVDRKPFLWSLGAEQPPTASVVFKITSPGNVEELLLHPTRGVARANGWTDLPEGSMTILKGVNQPTKGDRFVRVAITQEVVDHIKNQSGVVYCGGMGQATVQYRGKLLTDDTVVELSIK